MRDDSKPSRTALLVLGGTALTAADPRYAQSVDPKVAEWAFDALRAFGSPLAWLVKLAPVRWLVYRFERRLVPGIARHFATRKATIARLVKDASAKRLFVLGAGLDGLAYRYAKTIEAHEGDLPGSLDLKKRLLSRLDARPVQLHAVDAADPSFRFPDGVLGRSALVVAEGLFMYLAEDRVKSILQQVSDAGASVIFTFMGLDIRGRPSFGRGQDHVDGLLKRVGEPFTWGMRPEDAGGFLAECGLEAKQILGPDQAEGLVAGEWICFATTGEINPTGKPVL